MVRFEGEGCRKGQQQADGLGFGGCRAVGWAAGGWNLERLLGWLDAALSKLQCAPDVLRAAHGATLVALSGTEVDSYYQLAHGPLLHILTDAHVLKVVRNCGGSTREARNNFAEAMSRRAGQPYAAASLTSNGASRSTVHYDLAL